MRNIIKKKGIMTVKTTRITKKVQGCTLLMHKLGIISSDQKDQLLSKGKM
ncbi:hypothetical protein [Priestia koreensis]|nr:hypothetical protein [Priestia koreensis]